MPNFNPPDYEFSGYGNDVDYGSVLLLPLNGTDGATSTSDYAQGGNAPHAVTFNGNAQIDTAQWKYGGSSLLLDGTGDYVGFADSADWDLGLDNVPFTLEFWFRGTATGRIHVFADRVGTTNDWNMTDGHAWVMQYQNGDSTLHWYFNNNGAADANAYYSSASGILDGGWHHMAVVYDGTTTKIAIDGTFSGNASTGTYYKPSSCSNFVIGVNLAYTDACEGWIDDIRISKGVARYIKNFTPPPPHSARVNNIDQYATLLANFDGADGQAWYTPDSRSLNTYAHGMTFHGAAQLLGGNVLTMSGNADLDTSQKKFGTASLALVEPGSMTVSPSSAAVDFGASEDFTIQYWARQTVGGKNAHMGSGWSGTGWMLFTNGSTYLQFYSGGGVLLEWSSAFPTSGSWDHVAVTRSGSTVRLYVNGDLKDSGTYSSAYASSSFYVGDDPATGDEYTGFIDALHIERGIARWTGSSFTVPTTAPIRTVYSSLLCNFDGSDGSTTTYDESGVGAKFGDTALYLDGDSDYLTVPYNADFNFTDSNSWTIECWVRFSSVASSQVIVEKTDGGSPADGFQLYYHSGSTAIRFITDATVGLQGTTTISVNTWYHVAVSADGTTLRLFVDGNLEDSTTTDTLTNYEANLVIGYQAFDSTLYMNGRIDDLRITKGLARYTSAFTPPASALSPYQPVSSSSSSSSSSSGSNSLSSSSSESLSSSSSSSSSESTSLSSSSSSESVSSSSSSSSSESTSLSSSSSNSQSSSSSQIAFDSNTVLLVHGDGTDASTQVADGAIETGYPHILIPNGNAQIDTAQYKVGNASMKFDGTGDYFSIAASDDFDLRSGDFTVECWFRSPTDKAGPTAGQVIFTIGTADYNSLSLWWNEGGSNTISFQASTDGVSWDILIDQVGSISVDTWYHVALVRDGNTFRLFVDGTQVGSDTSASDILLNNYSVKIGESYAAHASYYFDGWIDELRISKGVARYTSNFDPPLSPLLPSAKDEDCVLLLHFDEADAATKAPDYSLGGVDSPHNAAFAGTAQIDTAQYKFGPSSLLLDGDSDYVSLPSSPDWNLGTAYTIEFWARATSGANLFGWGDGGNTYIYATHDGSQWNISYVNGGALSWKCRASGSWTADTWMHIAISKETDGNVYWYVNGVKLTNTDGNGGDFPDLSGLTLYIGAFRNDAGFAYFNGHIDEFRITKGLARYTSNFTPPTSKLIQYIGGTSSSSSSSSWSSSSSSSESVSSGSSSSSSESTSLSNSSSSSSESTGGGGANPCDPDPEMLLTVTGAVSKAVTWCGQTWNLPGDSGVQKSVCPVTYEKGTGYTSGPFFNGAGFAPGQINNCTLERWVRNTQGTGGRLMLARGLQPTVYFWYWQGVRASARSTGGVIVSGYSVYQFYGGTYTYFANMNTPPSARTEAKPATGNYGLTSKFFGTCTQNSVTLEWEQGQGW